MQCFKIRTFKKAENYYKTFNLRRNIEMKRYWSLKQQAWAWCQNLFSTELRIHTLCLNFKFSIPLNYKVIFFLLYFFLISPALSLLLSLSSTRAQPPLPFPLAISSLLFLLLPPLFAPLLLIFSLCSSRPFSACSLLPLSLLVWCHFLIAPLAVLPFLLLLQSHYVL